MHSQSALGQYPVYLFSLMSLCVFFICFYLIVCCFSVIWALLPEIKVMMMMMVPYFQGRRQVEYSGVDRRRE